MKNHTCLLLLFLIFNCKKEEPDSTEKIENSVLNTLSEEAAANHINQKETLILNRFSVPNNYHRMHYTKLDFGYFLQHLKLKDYGTLVSYYNGKQKPVNNIYNAVIDLPIGNKDLHQCADAAMRLRADYLYQHKRYDKISFHFLSDGKPRSFTAFAKGDFSQENYWKYLEYVFSSANTASLKNQLRSIDYHTIKIGDILLQQGNPYGHAVMVVDLAENEKGEKIVLLAQSYMPAQEIQILNNPTDQKLNPWYKVEQGKIKTPEWLFTSEEWKTWD
ncbi:DUF4846 domain-containing protein [Empedobacter brevis]